VCVSLFIRTRHSRFRVAVAVARKRRSKTHLALIGTRVTPSSQLKKMKKAKKRLFYYTYVCKKNKGTKVE